MQVLSRILSVLIILSLVSCNTVPMSVSQMPQIKYLRGDLSTLNHLVSQQTISPRWIIRPINQTVSYWTGDGGSGKSITILPPRAIGLEENLAYLPDLVANELVSNFSNFSDMTLFDRVSNQKQYDELLSGYYSDDEAAALDIGNLASTDYVLLGSITRTTTGYALQLTVYRTSDKTTVASYSGTVSIIELDNLTGVRRASLDLLPKMGVQLTEQARSELTREATPEHVNAMTAMAQGINAQRQGTEVAALTYFIQATTFDASLMEAVSRTNVLSANISTGNIGANVRNDIAWRSDWVKKLTEAETFIYDMLRNTTTQRTIWYTTNIVEREDARDYTRETTELRIEAALHTYAVFPVSVQRTVRAVYDGLQSTGRTQAWGLDGWPRYGVTDTNPFNSRWGGMVSIDFELLNEQNQVIGRRTVEMDSYFTLIGTRLEGPTTEFTTVRFTGVDAHAITDQLNIRIAAINGRSPEQAGISRIEPIAAEKMQADRKYTIYNGGIRPSSNDRNLGNITIPAELWGERVTFIPNEAFERRGVTSVSIPSSVTSIGTSAFANNQLSFVAIPPSVTTIGASAFASNRLTSVAISEGVTTIGARAFANNTWTSGDSRYGLSRITIPSSVTSIGNEAFASHWTNSGYDSAGNYYSDNYWIVINVTIGANVSLGNNAFGGGFEEFYNKTGKQAGAYRRDYMIVKHYSKWERFDNTEEMQKKVASREKGLKAGIIVFWGLVIAGGTVFFIYKAANK